MKFEGNWIKGVGDMGRTRIMHKIAKVKGSRSVPLIMQHDAKTVLSQPG